MVEPGVHPVSLGKANANGAFGLSSNVWEWVWDSYGPYGGNGNDGPDFRVFRGGGWTNAAAYSNKPCGYCRRVAHRSNADPGFRHKELGFRLVRNADGP